MGCRALGGVVTSQWGAGPTRVCGRGLEAGLWKRQAWLRRLWAWLHPKGGVAIPAGGVVIPVGGGGGGGMALPYMAGATQMGHMASLGGWGLGAWSVRPRPPS